MACFMIFQFSPHEIHNPNSGNTVLTVVVFQFSPHEILWPRLTYLTPLSTDFQFSPHEIHLDVPLTTQAILKRSFNSLLMRFQPSDPRHEVEDYLSILSS